MLINNNESLKINNKSSIFRSVAIIFCILFTSVIAPNLPASVLDLFDNSLVQFILFTLIAYIATNDLVGAIIATITVLITLQTLSVHKITNKIVNETKNLIESSQENINQMYSSSFENSESSEYSEPINSSELNIKQVSESTIQSIQNKSQEVSKPSIQSKLIETSESSESSKNNILLNNKESYKLANSIYNLTNTTNNDENINEQNISNFEYLEI